MTDVSPRGFPRVRALADFRELNVRTYVTAGDRPGVWFFSLDATQPVLSRIARAAFRLPYLDARIAIRRDGDAFVYESERTHLGGGVADLAVRYRPAGPAVRSAPGLARALPHRALLPLRDVLGPAVPPRGRPPAVAAPAGRSGDRTLHDGAPARHRARRRAAARALRRVDRRRGVAASPRPLTSSTRPCPPVVSVHNRAKLAQIHATLDRIEERL